MRRLVALGLTTGSENGHKSLTERALGEQPSKEIGDAKRHIEGIGPL